MKSSGCPCNNICFSRINSLFDLCYQKGLYCMIAHIVYEGGDRVSTRCFIVKKTNAGYKGIYSHWDGYPEEPGVGWMLKKYYTNPAKVTKLIALGSISSLDKNIGSKHSFAKMRSGTKYGDMIEKKQWTTAYHRDRGEPWSETKPVTFKTKDALEKYISDSWCEYLYVFEDGKWKVKSL